MRYSFIIDNIMINPKLRINFDSTSNEKRNDKEVEKFWGKPYILVEELELESWEEHYYRLKNLGWNDEKIGNKEEWNKYLKESKDLWNSEFVSGFRYTVRCLDGGAWDRSSWKGTFSDFDEALNFAKDIYKEYNE